MHNFCFYFVFITNIRSGSFNILFLICWLSIKIISSHFLYFLGKFDSRNVWMNFILFSVFDCFAHIFQLTASNHKLQQQQYKIKTIEIIYFRILSVSSLHLSFFQIFHLFSIYIFYQSIFVFVFSSIAEHEK